MKALLKALTTSLVLTATMIGTAQAAIITETWRSTVTSVSTTTAFAIGDMFNWTVTYNTDSQRMHSYSDGANYTADHGDGDDIPNETYCAGAEAGQVGCTVNQPSISLNADAVFDISELTAPIRAEKWGGDNDFFNINYAWRYDSGLFVPGVALAADDMAFDLNGFLLETIDLPTVEVFFTSVRTLIDTGQVPVQVPAPSTLALIGLGLLGMSRRMMK